MGDGGDTAGGDALGHDGHIFARFLRVQVDGVSYLLHLTAPLDNARVREIDERLLATQL